MKQLCIGFICGIVVCCGMWVLTQHETIAEATEYDRGGETQGGPALGVKQCLGDLNGDGVVNVSDLLILLGNWGQCPGACASGEGNCCENNGTPGCDNPACCEAVCAVDSYCCDFEWDSECAWVAENKFNDLCDCGPESFCGDGVCDPGEDCESCPEDCGECSPCDSGDGNCCVINSTPGCDNPACCNAVCDVDPYCCNVEWDSACALQAAGKFNDLCDCGPGTVCGDGVCDPGEDCENCPEDCGECPCDGGSGGDCCENNGTPGCDNPACCEAVCAVDPYCCDNAWDSICADQAANDFNDECGCTL
jgi:hypothetical protein